MPQDGKKVTMAGWEREDIVKGPDFLATKRFSAKEVADLEAEAKRIAAEKAAAKKASAKEGAAKEGAAKKPAKEGAAAAGLLRKRWPMQRPSLRKEVLLDGRKIRS